MLTRPALIFTFHTLIHTKKKCWWKKQHSHASLLWIQNTQFTHENIEHAVDLCTITYTTLPTQTSLPDSCCIWAVLWTLLGPSVHFWQHVPIQNGSNTTLYRLTICSSIDLHATNQYHIPFNIFILTSLNSDIFFFDIMPKMFYLLLYLLCYAFCKIFKI